MPQDSDWQALRQPGGARAPGHRLGVPAGGPTLSSGPRCCGTGPRSGMWQTSAWSSQNLGPLTRQVTPPAAWLAAAALEIPSHPDLAASCSHPWPPLLLCLSQTAGITSCTVRIIRNINMRSLVAPGCSQLPARITPHTSLEADRERIIPAAVLTGRASRAATARLRT